MRPDPNIVIIVDEDASRHREPVSQPQRPILAHTPLARDAERLRAAADKRQRQAERQAKGMTRKTPAQ